MGICSMILELQESNRRDGAEPAPQRRPDDAALFLSGAGDRLVRGWGPRGGDRDHHLCDTADGSPDPAGPEECSA